MSGKIKTALEYFINSRSAGDPVIAEVTKAKLILKGINPDDFNDYSQDDPIIMQKIFEIMDSLTESAPVFDSHILSAFSDKKDEQSVAEDIKQQLGEFGAEFLIYFASSSYNQKELSRYIHSSFRNSVIIGCSTAGEIISGKLSNNSVSAIAMSQKIVQSVKVEVVDLDKIDTDLNRAFSSFENFFGQSSRIMDPEQYVGIVLIDGMSMKEEKLMDLIGNKTNVLFVGASAGDDLHFSKTYVSAASDSFENSAVLALLKISNQVRFSIKKTQSFRSINKSLTANMVREEQREVIEFNGKPALEAYAEAIGVSAEVAPDYFSKNPVGLMVGPYDIFVRSPRQTNDSTMNFFCNIRQGETVHLLESTDIIEDTRYVLNDIIQEIGHIDGLICFNCVLRTVELEHSGKTVQYGNLFKDFTTAGFSTYGEEFIGHINQSVTMLAFSVFSEFDDMKVGESGNIGESEYIRTLKTENSFLRKDNNYLNRKLKQTIESFKAFNKLLKIEISERSRYEQEVEFLSYHDTLTGMYNRRYFQNMFKHLDTQDNIPITIVMGDVNGLKLINDSFGHLKGDQLLKYAADGIKRFCRKSDIVVRWGGDEFIILMPNTSTVEGMIIVDNISESYRGISIEKLPISVSFGIATKIKREENIDQLFNLAEDRMYENKRKKNQEYTDSIVRSITQVIAEKNPMEGAHINMVSELCERIGMAMELTSSKVENLRIAGLLHDIGKIAIMDEISSTSSEFSNEEWEKIKHHPDIGYRILSASKSLQELRDIIRAHHENWDGSGYPKGLKEDEIPIEARIVLIAGKYSRMILDVPYGKGFNENRAIEEIRKCAGTKFDPNIAKIFIEKVLGGSWE